MCNARDLRSSARSVALVVLLAIAVAAWSPLAPDASADPSAEAVSASFGAVADARVEEANPTTNFGSATRLGSDGDQGQRIASYLRFSLDGIRPVVHSATLRLYVVGDGSVDGPSVFPSSGGWREDSVTWDNSPAAAGPAVARTGAFAPGTWIEVDVTSLVKGDGSLDLLLSQSGHDGAIFYSRQGRYAPELTVTSSDPVVMTAGDIACKPGAAVTATTCHQARTAGLLTAEPWLSSVLMLGDGQYEDGSLEEYTGPDGYDATWGRLKAITRPTPGNHDYHVLGAPGYFAYFGTVANLAENGVYSFDLGSWHLISLNSEISAAVGSPQEQWLRADLAATEQSCILAYWHRPRFSSGDHGSSTSLRPLWQALYDAGADVVLSGHDHDYERFAPQDAAGLATPSGVRQFVVGTGGASHSPFPGESAPNSEVRDATTFGVLRMVLHPAGYDWRFVPDTDGGFADSGSAPCNAVPPRAAATATPDDGMAPLDVTVDASKSTGGGRTPIASYAFDFGDGSPPSGPQPDPVARHTYAAAGTYTVVVRVTDSAGQADKTSVQVTVRRNLVANPSFETGLIGWNTAGSGPGITLSLYPDGVAGAWSARLANDGTSPTSCVLNDTPNWVRSTTSGSYVGSMRVRAESSGARFRLRFREWNGPTLMGAAVSEVGLTTAWQTVTVRYSPVAAGLSTVDFNAYVPGAPPGTCFYADDVAITAE